MPAHAVPDGEGNEIFVGNVGIGTTTPVGGLAVMSGNVGIGTWKPDYRLDMARGTFSTHPPTVNDPAFRTAVAGAVIGLQMARSGIATWNVAAADDGAFRIFQSGNSDLINIRPGTFNVGIGTTAHQAGLAVMSGNVGIGTWSPRGVLEIVGGRIIVPDSGASPPTPAVAFSSNLSTGFYYSGGMVLTVNSSSNRSLFLTQASDVALGVGINDPIPDARFEISADGNTGQLPMLAMSSTDDADGDLLVFLDSGNLGIGTVGPTAKLQVVGGDLKVGLGTFNNPSANFDMYTTGNLEVDGSIFLADGTEINEAGDLGGDPGWTDDGDVVRLSTDTDRVGIGTTLNSAGTAFSVMNGNVGIGTWSAANSLRIRDSGDTTALYVSGGSSLASFVRNIGGVDGSIDLNIWNSAPQIVFDPGTGTEWYVGMDDTDNDLFKISPEIPINNTGFFVMNSDGNIGLGTTTPAGGLTVMSGNVGIGTWNPIADLEIIQTAQVPFMISSSPGAEGDLFAVRSGGVGIGTHTPDGKLHIKNAAGVVTARFQSATNFRSALELYSGSPGWEIKTDANENGGALQFRYSTNTTAFLANTSGNLGIADTSPDGRLEVSAGGGGTDLFLLSSDNDNDGDRFIVKNDGTVGIGTTAPVGGFVVMNGNVGIGTWSPSSELEVTTSLAIPQGTSPAVVRAGEIAVDTTDDQLIYYGGSKRVLSYKTHKSLIIESPADEDNFMLWRTLDPITITNIECIVDPADAAESVVIDLQERDGAGDNAATVDAAITCDNDGASDDGSLSNGTIDANDWLSLDIGTVTGTVTQLSVTIYYTVDAE